MFSALTGRKVPRPTCSVTKPTGMPRALRLICATAWSFVIFAESIQMPLRLGARGTTTSLSFEPSSSACGSAKRQIWPALVVDKTP